MALEAPAGAGVSSRQILSTTRGSAGILWSDCWRSALQAEAASQHSREMVEQSEELIERIDRGQGVYVVTYQQGRPDGIYFAGYSFD